jgi:hypothetical protein
MGDLERRIERLEARTGRGGCPGCQSGGPMRFTSTSWGDPEPEPCPACGRPPFRFTIRATPDRGDPDELP